MYKESSNQDLIKEIPAQIVYDSTTATLYLAGSWFWSTINEKKLIKLVKVIDFANNIIIDGDSIEGVDTTGIYFIERLITWLAQKNITISQLRLSADEQKLIQRIRDNRVKEKSSIVPLKSDSFLAAIGRGVFDIFGSLVDLLDFFGQFWVNVFKFLRSPFDADWDEVVRTIRDAGIKGVWVASLLSFLIGATLAYQMAPQFITYGANVYIVNFLGIALLKEVSPLLTAVIVAGRTGASITAEIGTRKVQEEIDALQTMGISTMQRIILPKVIGVMVAVPLITAIADMASMLGGAIVSNSALSVNYSLFIARMQTYVAVSNYTVGIIKSFAFALIVALVGCFCGLKVKGNANSIGEQTTKSVVAGIILIVFCDAIFAVIFNVLGL